MTAVVLCSIPSLNLEEVEEVEEDLGEAVVEEGLVEALQLVSEASSLEGCQN